MYNSLKLKLNKNIYFMAVYFICQTAENKHYLCDSDNNVCMSTLNHCFSCSKYC